MESSKFLPWNLESWSLESGILLKESWIPLTIGIRNPSCTVKESGIQYLDFEIQNSRLSWIPLKPGSHMPPMHLRHGRRYCLGYCPVMRIEVAGNIGHPSVLIRPRSSPGGTGRYVADTSAAYENQALHRAKRREFGLFPIFAKLMLTTKIHCVRFGMCEIRRLKWALPVFHI